MSLQLILSKLRKLKSRYLVSYNNRFNSFNPLTSLQFLPTRRYAGSA
jgi:hypothetical protein